MRITQTKQSGGYIYRSINIWMVLGTRENNLLMYLPRTENLAIMHELILAPPVCHS